MRKLAVVVVVLAACGRKSPPAPSPPPSASAPGLVPAAAQEASLGPVAGGAVTYVNREACKVPVDGADETWTLRWRSRPSHQCVEYASDQPCSDEERGSMELVRVRPGAPIETLLVDPLFDDGVAKLFDYAHADIALRDPMPRLETCGTVVMELADFDQDGRATEFALRTGRRFGAVVVGISRADEHLHAFGTRADPSRPLVLRDVVQWYQVRSSGGGPIDLATTLCEDGAREKELVTVRVIGGVFDATRTKKRCR